MKPKQILMILGIIVGALVLIFVTREKKEIESIKVNNTTKQSPTALRGLASSSIAELVPYAGAKEIGDTFLYLYLSKGGATSSLVFKHEVEETQPPSGSGSVLNVNWINTRDFERQFFKSSSTAQFDYVGNLIIKSSDGTLKIDKGTKIQPLPHELTDDAELNIFSLAKDVKQGGDNAVGVAGDFSRGSSRYIFLYSKWFNHAPRGMGAAAWEFDLYLVSISDGATTITTGFPYDSWAYGYNDGAVLYYRIGADLILSNYKSVLYFNYDHPEWGILTRMLP